MLFNSLSFLVFFPTLVIVYFIVPKSFQVPLLLIASCFFYIAYVPKYLFILFSLITLDFFLAQGMMRQEGRARTVFLWTSVVANLGMLLAFKYFDFFSQNVSTLAHLIHWNYSPLILVYLFPLGISFHVFQSLSYIIEVYRRTYEPERNFVTYALYVMFFPQLIAGPIERPSHLLVQFEKAHSFDEGRVVRGLERMLWGFFKKLVIADNLAQIVNSVYGSGTTLGPDLILAAVLFSYQLYCDFSGYSDIAVGTAMVLGFELTENFDRPYAARSITEFWRRWHISLSSWFRDYLYYPLVLSGTKHSPTRLYASLLATFVLIGFWHGANWTFVVMGALFGIYIIIESKTVQWRQKLLTNVWPFKLPYVAAIVETLGTFILVTIAWIFFRAENIAQALHIIGHLGSGYDRLAQLSYLRYDLWTPLDVSKLALTMFLLSILYLEITQYIAARKGRLDPWTLWPQSLRIAWRYGMVSIILLFGHFGGLSFIYFRF